MAYPLDANVFIIAKNLYYSFDICPAFWEWILREHATGKVFSIDKVRDELLAGNDELAQWAAGLPDSFFQVPVPSALPAFSRVAEWVNQNQTYSLAAKHAFLQSPDYYLVAQALAGGHTVVTLEVIRNTVHQVKIPNVCLGLGIACVTPFEMLRCERARFVLAQS